MILTVRKALAARPVRTLEGNVEDMDVTRWVGPSKIMGWHEPVDTKLKR